MSLEKYFRDEMDYLRLLGQEVAKERPHLASFLSEQGSDPDVERLLEGFAFLSGNLRAKIEDQFPELTHGLLNMLWPNYLRPTPSMTIIEYTPVENATTEASLVARGTQVLSRSLVNHNENPSESDNLKDQDDKKPDSSRCQFRICRDTWVFPFTIEDTRLNNSNEKGVLSIDFIAQKEMSLQNLQLDKLRFYLGDDDYTSHQLYLWLSHYFEDAELVVNDITVPLPDVNFFPVGFEPDDALLPYPKNAYSGYRILQEYFCFPESFMFFDFKGFPSFPETLKAKKFTLKLYFCDPLPADVKIRPTTMRLHCTPAINLFRHESEAIKLDGTQTEYPLRASYQHPERYEIFSIDRVESWLGTKAGIKGRVRAGVRVYSPFESFQHQIEYAKGRTALYYRTRATASPFNSTFQHSIAFVRGDETEVALHAENASISLTCTNGEMPLALKVGDICNRAEGNPSYVNFRNITRPSVPLHPVLDGSLHWSLISNMSMNYMTLLSKDALRQILRTYDLPSLHNRQAARTSQKRMDGIVKIETTPIDRLFKGLPVRGLKSTLYLKQNGAFNSEGELYLFSTVLARFFSLYASVNAFHLLKVVNVDNQESYEWPIQVGQHSLM